MQFTKSLFILVLISALGACSDSPKQAVGDTDFVITNEMDKFSYALGVSMAAQISQLEGVGLDSLNIDLYIQAVRQTVLKQELQMSIDEAHAYVQNHISGLRSKWTQQNQDKLNSAGAGTGPDF